MKYDARARQRALEHIRTYGPAPTHYRMARMAGKNVRVLELGCATGYVSQLLKNNSCRVIGIEIDPDAAREAEAFCERVIVGDLSDPELLDGIHETFDVVLCGDILEHLPDPESVLVKLRDMLADRGFVLASIPNVAYWKMRWDMLLGRFEYQDSGILDRTHLRFYTVETFRKLAENCGYTIVETVVNDAGFPGSALLEKLPLIKRPARWLALKLADLRPNLFVFHSIYKLVPDEHPSGERS